VVVGSISAVTCVLYFIPFILRIAGIFVPVWDFILFVLWIALFGVFGKVSQWNPLFDALADLSTADVH